MAVLGTSFHCVMPEQREIERDAMACQFSNDLPLFIAPGFVRNTRRFAI